MEKKDLNTYIGDIGPYQWRVFITVFTFAIYCADAIHIIFIAGKMPYWCGVPELVELPYDVQKNVAIPAQSADDHDGSSVEYSSCEMFALNYSMYNRSQFYSWNRSLMITNETSIVQCSQWTYDQSQFISTIVSKVQCAILKVILNKLCRRQPQYASAPCKLTISSYQFTRWHLFRHVGYLKHKQQVDLVPFDLERSVRVRCDVGYLCANFSLSRHLCSRVRPDLRDRQTSDRQTSDKRTAECLRHMEAEA